MHGCNILTLLMLKTAVNMGSGPGEQVIEVDPLNMPGPSGLSSTGPSNETDLFEGENNIQSDDDDNTSICTNSN